MCNALATHQQHISNTSWFDCLEVQAPQLVNTSILLLNYTITNTCIAATVACMTTTNKNTKKKQLRQHFEVLGWNVFRWENNDPPPSNGKPFADLNPQEQVQGLGFRVQGLGFDNSADIRGFRVQGVGFRVQGVLKWSELLISKAGFDGDGRFRVQGLGFRVTWLAYVPFWLTV